jgi:photosystem II stability/assembly factor-like uncharacterized protein
MKPWLASILIPSLLLCACGGGGGMSAGSPVQVDHLQASTSTTSLGVPVNFSVQCTAAQGTSANLSYQWHYGDESDPEAVTDTTSVPTASHAYVLKPGAPVLNNYDTYQFYVTCQDTTQAARARAPAQDIKVLREDLTLSAQLCSSGAAGLGWCWQSPLPGGEGLSAVAAVSDQLAWAAGDYGTVLRTTDGGNTWLPLYLGGSAVTLPLLKAIGARDANNAWVVGVNGSFWVTSDGGSSWSHTGPPTPLQAISLVAIDSTHAFAINETVGAGSFAVALNATADAGASWTVITVPGVAPTDLRVVAALDAQNIFVAGQQFELDTADGGTHWTTPLFIDSVAAGNIWTLSPTRGSRCGNSDAAATGQTVWLGTDASNSFNWTRGAASAGASHAGGTTLGAFDGRTAWMSDVTGGSILATRDALQSVTSVTSPFPLEETLNAFDTPDCTTGWAVGAYGEIARTTDGAVSWVAQSSKNPLSPNFLAIAARSNLSAVAFALSYAPQDLIHPIYHVVGTEDGLSWQEQHADTVAYVDSAYRPFIATDAAGDVVCGSEVYLTIYADGAWSGNLVSDSVPPTDPGFVSFIGASISGRTAWILEGNQTQVLLDDLSAHLPYASVPKTPIPPSPQLYPRAIAAVDASHAVIVGGSGLIQLVSYSGGTFQWGVGVSGTTSQLEAVALGGTAGTATSGWAVGGGGTLLRTTDGGQTWTAQSWPSDQVFDTRLTSVSTIDGTEGWVGGNQVMMHTTDGGAHWTLTDMTIYGARVAAAGRYAAWAAGPGSFMRKTLTGGVVPPSN